jgi:two-component system, OmpR family, alkaline phosphatase synthesis response regulator PhoP
MLTVMTQGQPLAKARIMKRSVLIVEDEEDIRELLSYTLIRDGYQVATVSSGEEALAVAEAKTPDLVLLDLMLPGLDGLTVCRKLRANPKTAGVAIVMLTAKGEEGDIVTGLNMGANDYITKPFSRNVLLARLRAVLRNMAVRSDAGGADDPEAEVKIHNLLIHPGRHAVLVDGEPVELSATEFRMLCFLVRKPGWVFTREQILDAVHGDNYAITERAVDVHVVSLRRKLADAGQYIETVRGVGYRFRE